MKNPYLLLDVDGVCLDWQAGIWQYAQTHHAHLIKHDQTDPHARDLVSWLKISHDEANALLWDFHYDESFEQLKPLPGTVAAIARFVDKYKLVAITSCGDDPIISAARKRNLQWAFGRAFTEIHCLNMSYSKKPLLCSYAPTHWVEDHVKNALLGLECGHTCWLVDCAYNRNCPDKRVGRIDSLYDLCEIIL
jgi:FMN phosphatase YigB (HAD superfamily)